MEYSFDGEKSGRRGGRCVFSFCVRAVIGKRGESWGEKSMDGLPAASTTLLHPTRSDRCNFCVRLTSVFSMGCGASLQFSVQCKKNLSFSSLMTIDSVSETISVLLRSPPNNDVTLAA